jgi:sec-independent protein translocase protein TatC
MGNDPDNTEEVAGGQEQAPDQAPNQAPNQAQGEMTFVEHLVELRNRLLRVVLAVLCFLVVLFPFANDLYALLAEPLLRHLPEGTSMIATQVASPFLTPFKLSIVLSIFLAMPVVLYQVWSFVAPGLYKHERRLIFPLLITSSVLFYLGMAFAYFVVFPLMFAFFQAVAPEGVAIMTDITAYLDFVLKIFFAFGIAFEVPIATILLVWTGFTTPAALVSKRPYIIVGAFVLGMMLTPPDIISQTLLALPVWLLFELGVIFSKFYAGKRLRSADEDEAAEVYEVIRCPLPFPLSPFRGRG